MKFKNLKNFQCCHASTKMYVTTNNKNVHRPSFHDYFNELSPTGKIFAFKINKLVTF